MRKRSVLIKGIPVPLLKAVDKKIEEEGKYPDRSECLRDLMRNYVTEPPGLTCQDCGANIYVGSNPDAAQLAIEEHRLECPKRKVTVEVSA